MKEDTNCANCKWYRRGTRASENAVVGSYIAGGISKERANELLNKSGSCTYQPRPVVKMDFNSCGQFSRKTAPNSTAA